MPLGEFVPIHVPRFAHLREIGFGDDEGIELHVLAAEAVVGHIAQPFEKIDFIVVRVNGFMHHAVGFDEDDALFGSLGYPEDKIGIEPVVLIEADAFAAALVSEEEYLLFGEVLFAVFADVTAQVFHELLLTLFQGRRRGFRLTCGKERLIEVPVVIGVGQCCQPGAVDFAALYQIEDAWLQFGCFGARNGDNPVGEIGIVFV